MASQSDDQVILQVEHPQFRQAVKGLVVDGLDLAAVEKELADLFAADKGLTDERSWELVPVQVDGRGIHGNQRRDPQMALVGTLDDVGGPRSIVEARTALGTLHPTVAREEVTALAEREAMRLILTQKLIGVNLHNRHSQFAGEGKCAGGVLEALDEPALDGVQVGHFRVALKRVREMIDPLYPFHLAVADERVAAQENLGS